jgi:hypothetical protein
MVQELINLLPRDPGSLGLIIAVIGSLIGVGIWLLGARYSRWIITLLTVLLGATIGMHTPLWFGWEISGAGPAVGGALVLGVTGYVLHGMWVGIGLGTILASWTSMACWMMFRNGAGWDWPAWDASTTIVSYSTTMWQSLPPDVVRILPWAAIAAMISGLAIAILWPKLSLIVGWSLAGTTLLAGMGVAAMEYAQPQWLVKIPSPLWAQAMLLACFTALGSMIQWKLGPKPAASTKTSSKKKAVDKAEEE